MNITRQYVLRERPVEKISADHYPICLALRIKRYNSFTGYTVYQHICAHSIFLGHKLVTLLGFIDTFLIEKKKNVLTLIIVLYKTDNVTSCHKIHSNSCHCPNTQPLLYGFLTGYFYVWRVFGNVLNDTVLCKMKRILKALLCCIPHEMPYISTRRHGFICCTPWRRH